MPKLNEDSNSLFCAPDIKSNGTCYTKENLIFLIKSYNKNKLKKDKILLANKSKKKMWQDLNKKLSKDCNNEWCWLEQNFVPAPFAKKNIKEKFKPEMPKEWDKNPFEWLSSTDIKNVMKQYEKKYPDFLFLGPVPVDCPSSITCVLSGLSVEILINKLGKTKLGIIYNLDEHDEPGSHWVASYFDFKKCKILYFDSVGMPPPKMILSFLQKMKKGCEDYYLKYFNKTITTDIYSNNTRFQFGNSECGIFSMNFIISNLQGNLNLNKNIVNDTVMNDLRKVYYRPYLNKSTQSLENTKYN
jgi:hypothetical protein